MNVDDLKNDVDFLCGSTSATYPDSDKMRNMNVGYHDIARIIWESDGSWNYDDSNNTDVPKAYRTMVDASATYLIPTTALRIEGIEVKNINDDWYKLKPLDYHDIPISPEEYLNDAGLPKFYELDGNRIRLFPPPGTGYTTMTSGLMVRLARGVTELKATASTAVPGFAAPFHRILSYSTALDFEQDNQHREFLAKQKARLEKGLTLFYAKRASEMKTKVKPATKKRWRNYT